MNTSPDHLPKGSPNGQPAQPMAVDTANELLRQFSCPVPDRPVVDVSISKLDVREALLTVKERSDYQIFGICADSLQEGLAALQDYTHALGYAVGDHQLQVNGPAYIKFNVKSGFLYADGYEGENRGVLVSCQSAYESGVNEMYGPLPLDLYR